MSSVPEGCTAVEPSAFPGRLEALGIVTDERANRRKRLHNAASILIPMAGTLCALASLPWLGFTAATLVTMAILSVLTMLGIELGLHRYFTHRSFRTGRALHTMLALFATWSFQSPITRWVADHRRHHRFADQPYDPHSPYWIDDMRTGGVKGFLWSHVLWIVIGRASSEQRYAPDILADPVASHMSRHYWGYATSGIVAAAVTGFLLGGTAEAVRCLLWAGCVRVTLLHHFTWAVNSVGHMAGTKPGGARDESRDNVVLALLTLGGGLHAYHHEHPAAAVNRPRMLDAIGGVVIVLEAVGVVRDVRRR